MAAAVVAAVLPEGAAGEKPGRRMFARLDVAPGDPLSPVVVSYKKLCRDAEASSGGALPSAAPSFPREGVAAKTSLEERAEGDGSGAAGEEGDEEGESSSDEGGSDEGDEEGSQDEGGSGSESAGHGPADWYDVDDAFIDDSEILEVPEESAGKAKHNGFFVNKGEIERERQPGVPAPPVGASKKRKHEGADAGKGKQAAAGKQDHDGARPDAKKTKPTLVKVEDNASLLKAIEELHAVVVKAPLPPDEQKRKSLTPEMMDGLDKIKRIISVYAELPRGLTSKLMHFMEPYAGISTLRRRLGSDLDAPAPAVLAPPPLAPPPLAPIAVAQPPTQAPQAVPPPVAAAASEPPPSAATIERDMATLRARVQARCAALKTALGGSGGGTESEEFQASVFKWDRECEDALYTVLLNSQRMGAAAHKSVYKNLLASDIWPQGLVDVAALKLAYTRVSKRKKGASGGGRPKPAAAPVPH